MVSPHQYSTTVFKQWCVNSCVAVLLVAQNYYHHFVLLNMVLVGTRTCPPTSTSHSVQEGVNFNKSFFYKSNNYSSQVVLPSRTDKELSCET